MGAEHSLIDYKDRIIAGVGAVAAVSMVVAAKSMPYALSIWTIVVLASWRRQLADDQFRQNLLRPNSTFLAAAAFATFAIMSAIWAKNPYSASVSGLSLLLILAVGHLLSAIFHQQSPVVKTLVGGWFAIGFVIGGIILLFQIMYGYQPFTWLLTKLPWLGLSHGSMIEHRGEKWVLRTIALANWSVAGLSMLLGPMLLIITTQLKGWVRACFGFSVLALVSWITFKSDHQTSYVAIIAGTTVYLCTNFFSKISFRGVQITCVFALLAIAPGSYIAYHEFDFQRSSLFQDSLKQRFEIWANAAARVADAPILGVGANNTVVSDTVSRQTAANKKTSVHFHPHNMFLQTWLELGGFGATIMLAGILTLFRDIKKLDERVHDLALATVTVVFVQASATWNIWSAWFLVANVLIYLLFSLGCTAMRTGACGQTPDFFSLWLPNTDLHSASNK